MSGSPERRSGNNSTERDLVMKKKIAAVVVTMIIASAGMLAAQEAREPRIEAPEVRYDAGKVVQGARVSHLFEVRNAGDAPLIIDRVVPS